MNEEKTGDVTVPGVARITTMQQKGDELYFEAVTDVPLPLVGIDRSRNPKFVKDVQSKSSDGSITIDMLEACLEENLKPEFTEEQMKFLEVHKRIIESPELRPMLEKIVERCKEKALEKPNPEEKRDYRKVETLDHDSSSDCYGMKVVCEEVEMGRYDDGSRKYSLKEGDYVRVEDYKDAVDEIDRLNKELAHIKMLKKATDDYTEGIQLTNYSKIITIDNQEYVIKKVKEENEALRVAKEDWHQVAHLNRIDMEQFQARVKELEILNYQMLEAHKQKDEAYDLLLKEYEKSVERVKELEVVMNGDIHCIEALRMENEALRAKVEELEKESSWAKTELKAVSPVLFEGLDRGG